VELRIHGVGGPTPESTLRQSDPTRSPQPETHAWAIWRSEPGARSAVRAVPGLDDHAVYQWSPLTSGSIFFALWPLLLPFTLVNVSGWMLPDTRRRQHGLRWIADTTRDGVARSLVLLMCWSVTVSTVMWLAWLGQVVAAHLVPATWGIAWHELTGLVVSFVAVGLVVAIATWTARGYERYPAPATTDPVRRSRDRRHLSSPTFFRDAREHRVRWRWHVTLAALSALAAGFLTFRAEPWSAPVALADAAVAVTIAQCTVLAALAICCLPRSLARLRGAEDAPALLGAFGAATIGALLVPALTASAAIAIGGVGALAGRAGILVDVVGVSVGVFLGLSVVLVVVRVATPVNVVQPTSTNEPRLLGSLAARMWARLVTVPRRLDLPLAATSSVLVGGVLVVGARRWNMARMEITGSNAAVWVPTESAAVSLARAAIVALVGFMFISVWRRRADEASRRRVGTIWDVLTFWPRAHHPFAVRPYAERAVPELQEYLRYAARRGEPLDVVAHSQGSVLALAALLPMATDDSPDVACLTDLRLITAGSPLRTLYERFFPAHVRRCDITALDAALSRVGRGWCNVYRYTDYVGRAVFGPDSRPGHFDDPGPHDLVLADPPAPGQPVAGHSGYWGSADVEQIIDSRRSIGIRGGLP
jgi:hypothetical protein